MGNGNRPTPGFRREAVRLTLTSGRTRRGIEDILRAIVMRNRHAAALIQRAHVSMSFDRIRGLDDLA